MDDLVGVAAEQEMSRTLEGLQDQGKLGVSQILDLVHHHEVLMRSSQAGQVV